MSRDETSFPVYANSSRSSAFSSERMGAFGEMSFRPEERLRMQLPPQPQRPVNIAPEQAQFSQATTPSTPLRVDLPPPSRSNSARHGSSRHFPIQSYGEETHAKPHVSINPSRAGVAYLTTTHEDSHEGSSESRRRHEKLSEVYSQSGDTVEFARNLSDYVNEKIPYQLSIGVLLVLIIIALMFLICGAINIPFCPLQPLIPIWLSVAGGLFIISATFRIYFLIPQPRQMRRHQRRLGANLLCKDIELLFALANIVWLILGCVWVYGGRQYVHFEEGLFEQHYCEPLVYWTAFLACTSFLVIYCVIIVAVICLLCVGTWKESSQDGPSTPPLLN